MKMIKPENFRKAKELIIKRHICLNTQEDDYDIIVSIPCLADENIFETVESLKRAKKLNKKICIFILLNEPEGCEKEMSQKNKMIYEYLKGEDILLKYVQNIPRKVAGAGFARRLIMDEIICILERIRKLKNISDDIDFFRNKIIVSLDSDCTVSENYFEVLSNLLDFGVFLFSHRLSDIPEISEAGILWELFLRYWRNSLRVCGYIYSFYPIGSLFAFRTSVYIMTGGMNTNKGGEDFYFLQKIVPYFSVSDIPAYVFPKAEPSGRTPFGTGMEIKKYISGEKERITKTWKFEAFEKIGETFLNPENGFFKDFLKENPKYLTQIQNLKSMSKDQKDFIEKFRKWLNLFKVLKMLRFSEKILGRAQIKDEVAKLISRITKSTDINSHVNPLSNLEILKKYDEENLQRIQNNISVYQKIILC